MNYILPNIPNSTDSLLSHKKEKRKAFAVLLDPDKLNLKDIPFLVESAINAGVTYFFVGGSLMVNEEIYKVIPELKKICPIPVILFPGSLSQIVPSADAIFFLSLISGRNPELLIGNHVLAAPLLKRTNLEIIPTGYMLVESGKMTTVNYISNTLPIPSDKTDIAICTAMAGEMLGLKVIYMDGGSGAYRTIPPQMVKGVTDNINIPVIVGGGIRTAEEAVMIWEAGAEVVVIGNALESGKDVSLMQKVGDAMYRLNANL